MLHCEMQDHSTAITPTAPYSAWQMVQLQSDKEDFQVWKSIFSSSSVS